MNDTALKKQKYLSLALFILLLMVLFIVVHDVIWKKYSFYFDSISQSERQIAQSKALLANAPNLEAKEAAVQNNNSVKDQLLAESNQSQAEAALQGKLKNLIEANQGTVSVIQILPAQQVNESLMKISVKAQTVLQPQSYEGLLRSIEEAKPFLFIDDFRLNARRTTVRVPKNAQQNADVSGNTARQETIAKVTINYSVNLTVSGYIKHQGGDDEN